MTDQDGQNRDRPICDYMRPTMDELAPSIFIPTTIKEHFKLKPIMFQMLNTITPFTGAPTEDPYSHLRSFLHICDTFTVMSRVNSDVIRLTLFPCSLRDQAKYWLDMLPARSITTWTDLAEKFLRKFFPIGKTIRLRTDILTFRQLEGESLHEAWERYNGLIMKCPHHGIPDYIQIETFYYGLVGQTRNLVDAKAGGALLGREYEEIHSLLDKMSWESCIANSPCFVRDKYNPCSSNSYNHQGLELEEVINQIYVMFKHMVKIEETLQSHGDSIRNIQVQLAQIAQAIEDLDLKI
ncbi:hypothetical protein ACJIZ3_020088 [Penstemon smallii]|uniref:Retrotransposon gag domain-containing protein n=1 Tax=Penstemon smallii TaxID=265156 RepID=A0ABD3SHM0_9LAMI